jgi:trigger factor
MKTEFVDVNETRKNVRVEIPKDIVDAEIDRVANDYSRKARVPGFRPGKAPSRVIKQRYKEQILHDVLHDLVPRAVDDALRERGMEAVDTPDVRDVTIDEGQPLTFTASFDTVPSFDPGDLSSITIRKPKVAIDDEAVNGALERLRDRAARHEPVEGRAVEHGDTVVVDLERRAGGGSPEGKPAEPATTDKHESVSIEVGAKANPPGFDEQLLGLTPGAVKTFDVHYPSDYPIGELANTTVSYTVKVHALKRRVLPELDDEFAKDLGLESLEALRTRVREDLEHEAMHAADREVRAELMKQLAARLPFEAPGSLVEREIDHRIEDFARRLMEQHVDPRTAGINWSDFRESQREVAREAVSAALVLDEITRREQIGVSDEEIAQEVERYAERTGRTAAAVHAALEREGGMSRVAAGLRREKSIDLVMSRATISS